MRHVEQPAAEQPDTRTADVIERLDSTVDEIKSLIAQLRHAIAQSEETPSDVTDP